MTRSAFVGGIADAVTRVAGMPGKPLPGGFRPADQPYKRTSGGRRVAFN
jgi:hypothetical protein